MSSNVKDILIGRGARNIYFWLIAIYFVYTLNDNADDYDRSVYNYYKALTTLVLISMTYVNNLLLVPKLLAKKKRVVYFLCALLLLVVTGTVYVVVIKNMLITYPDIEVHEISLVSSPVGASWTLNAFMQEMPSYAFGLGLWLISFTMAWFMMDHSRQQKLAQVAMNKQLETELTVLRNQVSPHFFFNTLNNIYGLTLQQSEKAPESILKLSSVMRYLLYETNTKEVSFEKEKEAMQSYIDMELLRLPDNKDFLFKIEADRNYSVPPLLWLPILENVFKHGTRMIADNYFINYSFTIQDSVVQIEAENNYKEDNNANAGGLGLSNLRKRLSLLYPGSHNIDVNRGDGKYSIKVTVKLN